GVDTGSGGCPASSARRARSRAPSWPRSPSRGRGGRRRRGSGPRPSGTIPWIWARDQETTYGRESCQAGLGRAPKPALRTVDAAPARSLGSGVASTAPRHGRVALLRLSNPPVNGLAHEVRRALAAGLEEAMADPRVAAVV